MATIPMANCDLVALVDDEDVETVASFRWSAHQYGRSRTFYATATSGRTIYMHRLLAGRPGLDVDHRNGDGLDNRRANLRSAPHALNLANQRPQVGRLSSFKGVSMRPSGHWYAYIKVDQKMRHLGTFSTEEAAARAYDAAAIEAWSEYARPNFPQAVNA